MGPDEGSGAVAGRVARPGTGGVVSRPGLFERLGASARVTVVSAPPGSGKTVLLRSWLGEAGLEESAAWVSVGPGETDPQQFWLSVLGALRRTSAGSGLVRPVTAAPDLVFSDAQDVHVGVVQGGHRRAGKTPPGGGGRGSGWTGWRRGGQSVAASSVIAVRAEDSSTMVLAVV